MSKKVIVVSILGITYFACGTSSDTNDSGIHTELAGEVGESLLAGNFGYESNALPDCSPLLNQLNGEEPGPGINCIERRLYWWLGGAKTTFSAAAIVEIGDEVLEKDIDLTDAWDTDLVPIHPGFLPDSKVETVIYGEIPTDPLLSCYEYGTLPKDTVPSCGSGFGELWYVYKGRALAFFGGDCILQAYNDSCASIYRLYPIRDDKVFDYDGSSIALEEVLTLIGDGGDDWSGDLNVAGYSICPEGLKFLDE